MVQPLRYTDTTVRAFRQSFDPLRCTLGLPVYCEYNMGCFQTASAESAEGGHNYLLLDASASIC